MGIIAILRANAAASAPGSAMPIGGVFRIQKMAQKWPREIDTLTKVVPEEGIEPPTKGL